MSLLADRVIAVTGAASGIGRGLAVALASRGAHLALADIDEAGLEETERLAKAAGRPRVSRHVVDVADRAAVYAFADASAQAHGAVDGVVNNAGVALTDTVETLAYDDFEWIMGINFWGVVYGTKAFLPRLKERPSAWIVNVSSIFGIIGVPSQSAYNATKFAVRGFTEALRQELHGTGVAVSCVHPGGIKTNIARRARHGRSHDGMSRDEAVATFDQKLARTSAEEAGRIIADGMEARAPRIMVGADARIGDVMQRVLPVRYANVARALSRRVRS